MSVLDFLLICLSIMLTSAASNAVNIAVNIKNVICTDVDGMPEIAARVGINPSIAHGWRPASAVTHPASLHIHTNGMDIIDIHCIHFDFCIIRVLYSINATAIKNTMK